MKIVYTGPSPVKHFQGAQIKLERGVPADVPDAFGRLLLEQEPQHYQRASTTPAAKPEKE